MYCNDLMNNLHYDYGTRWNSNIFSSACLRIKKVFFFGCFVCTFTLIYLTKLITLTSTNI